MADGNFAARGDLTPSEWLRRAPDDELWRQYDIVSVTAPIKPEYWLDELNRRETRRQTNTMRRLTWVITFLTVVNVGFVILAALCR